MCIFTFSVGQCGGSGGLEGGKDNDFQALNDEKEELLLQGARVIWIINKYSCVLCNHAAIHDF
jgi:hypothetical protein